MSSRTKCGRLCCREQNVGVYTKVITSSNCAEPPLVKATAITAATNDKIIFGRTSTMSCKQDQPRTIGLHNDETRASCRSMEPTISRPVLSYAIPSYLTPSHAKRAQTYPRIMLHPTRNPHPEFETPRSHFQVHPQSLPVSRHATALHKIEDMSPPKGQRPSSPTCERTRWRTLRSAYSPVTEGSWYAMQCGTWPATLCVRLTFSTESHTQVVYHLH